MNSKKIKLGVIGVGYLGKHHVKHLSQFECVDLVGIYDINKNLMNEVANQYKVPTSPSIDELYQKADAISIVTPTKQHYEIAIKALEHNCHIFIEKPISDSIKSAELILKKKLETNKVVHVGHIERFNPAFKSFMKQNRKPLFLECHRLTKINNRSMDISVVEDLMIHDIDLVLQMVDSPIKKIIADGINVISDNVDLANVKLIFRDSTVANLTASRISNKDMRKIRVFENQKYSSIDLFNKDVIEYSASKDEQNKLIFQNKSLSVDNYDALAKELAHFCDCIMRNDINTKNINNSIEALQIAQQINQIIQDKVIK